MFVNFCTWCKVEVQIPFFFHTKIPERFEADSELKASTAKTVPNLCTIPDNIHSSAPLTA